MDSPCGSQHISSPHKIEPTNFFFDHKSSQYIKTKMENAARKKKVWTIRRINKCIGNVSDPIKSKYIKYCLYSNQQH